MPFLVFVFFIFFLIILIPLRVDVSYDIENRKDNIETLNYIKIYILYFIKIKTVKLDKNFKGKSYNKVLNYFKDNAKDYNKVNRKIKKFTTPKIINKFMHGVSFKKINLNLNISFGDYILNAYIVTIITTFINLYIAKNTKKFDIESSNILVYSNPNQKIDLKLHSIIYINLVNTIIVIFDVLIRRIEKWKINNILLRT